MWYKRGYFKKPYKRLAQRYSKGGLFSTTKLARDVAYLKSVVNVEKKFIDNSVTAAVSNTAQITLINGVATGTDNTERTGDSIKMSGIRLNGYYTLNASATNDLIRVAIIMDRQVNGSAPSYTDIYESTGGVVAQRNKNTVDRFVVLKDYQLQLSTAGDTIKKIDCYIKLASGGKDVHTKYNGNTNGIASVYTNAVYLVVLGTQPTNTSTQSIITRVRFIDN